MKYIIIFLVIFSSSGFSAKSSEFSKSELWLDLKESAGYLLKGSYLQFTTKNNLYYSALALPTVWYSFENDKRINSRYAGSDIRNIVDNVGDAGVILSFPVVHAGFYYYGKKFKNDKSVQFAKEYFAAMYLALIESGILSYIQIHSRPDTSNVSFWESEFRGNSSWPSGHVIPYSVLFFKTLQFYGPKWSALPLVLTVMSSMQRIKDKKHWLSDVTAAFFISAWASEGVRKAAGYNKNHAFYKWIFEHDVQLGVLKYKSKMGPKLVWNF